MAFVGLKIDYDQTVLKFVWSVRKRLNVVDMVRNPFMGSVGGLKNGSGQYIFFDLKPFYPDVMPSLFYYWAFRKGLKKAGYKGKVKLLSRKESLNILGGLVWDKTKYSTF